MTGEILAEEQFIRVKRCRNGLFMYNVNDKYIGQALDHYGEFSEGETELFRKLVKPNMVVLDIGANIGAHTVTFAKLVKPHGAVIAFEPQRVVHQTLCGNIALNALDNAAALWMALGKQVGEILVPHMDYAKPDNFGGVELISSGRGEVVPMNTLDAFNPPNCHFMKIDVEGMEQEVIEGGLGLLARARPILYVENDRREKAKALVGCLRQAGYLTYWHIPELFNPQNYFGATDNLYPRQASFNVLCVPPSSGIDVTGLMEVTPENAADR